MTGSSPDDLARALADLHAEAFAAPWDASAFAALLSHPGMVLEAEAGGFVLVRVAADEAEVLTLAVRPASRRAGLGARLMRAAAGRSATLGARRLFLEVAEDNLAARHLYDRLGFQSTGRRPRYYARQGGPSVDALLLAVNLDGPLPSA